VIAPAPKVTFDETDIATVTVPASNLESTSTTDPLIEQPTTIITTVSTTGTSNISLSYESLKQIQSIMANTFQSGNISATLGLNINGLTLEEPIPPPTMPELLTDSESRGALSEDGTTYGERSVKNDSELLQELLQKRELVIPIGLKIANEPFECEEMMPMKY